MTIWQYINRQIRWRVLSDPDLTRSVLMVTALGVVVLLLVMWTQC